MSFILNNKCKKALHLQPTTVRYYIIAGEASGDLHASNLVKQLTLLDNQAQLRGWGGQLMATQGVDIVKHYKDLAFMGFIEVVANLRTILNNLKFCKQDILAYKPDVLILVDYPGFNIRIAKWAKAQGIRVVYYISPQVWAWKENRVKTLKQCVDKMLVILPFEKEFYKGHNFNVDYVGHPLLDALANNPPKNLEQTRPTIALLPGSRKQEVGRMLPIMLQTIPYFPQFDFVVAATDALPHSYYQSLVGDKNVKVEFGNTYNIIKSASAALVKSGTSTLETALIGTPQVVCYKGSWASYQIAKRVIRVKYISLVNLIMNKEVVKEVIQNDMNADRLQKELDAILLNPVRKAEILNDYNQLRQLLGGGGASAKAAGIIFDFVKK